MRKIGYARVSSPHQNLDRQIAALRSEHCHAIFREKASGRDIKNRPQLEKAIDALGKGDILVLAEWDRATRGAPCSRWSTSLTFTSPRPSAVASLPFSAPWPRTCVSAS